MHRTLYQIWSGSFSPIPEGLAFGCHLACLKAISAWRWLTSPTGQALFERMPSFFSVFAATMALVQMSSTWKLVTALGAHKEYDWIASSVIPFLKEGQLEGCDSARADAGWWEGVGKQRHYSYLYCHSSRRLRSGLRSVSHCTGT